MNSENMAENGGKLDLSNLLHDGLTMVRRLWWIAVALSILFSGLLAVRARLSYHPIYKATATFTVYVGNPMQSEVQGYNTKTAEQMAKTFPYILTSGALKDMVMRDLNIPGLPPVRADVLNDTNIFTLTVQAPDPALAYNVLDSIIRHYPDVAEFVVGPTVMSLLDESGVPTEPSNKVSYLGAVQKGTLMGVGLWVLLILVLSMARSTVHNEEELKQVINLRCVGVLPQVKGLRRAEGEMCPMVTGRGDFRTFSEAVRLMRMRVEKELESRGDQVLLVTSATPSEGKTTVAINLAAALGMKGKKTLLVDCDLRNPSVAKNLSMENKNGLADVLRGNISVEQAVRKVENQFFSVVVAGGPVNEASELLSQKGSREFMEWCRAEYDCVILDTPPSSLMTDAAEIAVAADAALLVIRQNYASKSQIMDGASVMTDSGLHMVGCVLNYSSRNALSDKSGYYGYGYGYGYGGYGSYGGYHSRDARSVHGEKSSAHKDDPAAASSQGEGHHKK